MATDLIRSLSDRLKALSWLECGISSEVNTSSPTTVGSERKRPSAGARPGEYGVLSI